MRKLQDKGCYTSEDKLPTKDEISVPAKQLTCEEEQCGPPLGMPNYLCPDGETIAGPGDCIENAAGECNWEIIECPEISGYLRETGVSDYQDACSQYYLESESGEYITNVTDLDNIESLAYFENRYVTITGEDVWCVECGAVNVEAITLPTDCETPVLCVADPCYVAPECLLNTPVECVSNYCGGCFADFYDSDNNLVDCNAAPIDECTNLTGVFFGLCDMYMGTAVVDEACSHVSGCGWVVDGIDYSDAFFNSIDECEAACGNDDTTCDEIVQTYGSLHTGEYATCEVDNDCIAVWGDCGVGLGGCHYSVNEENHSENEINDLVNQWIESDCMEAVCDCMAEPYAQCINNTCTSAYCMGDNPAGCSQTGCDEGYVCNSDPNDCIPSSCFCDGFFDDWYCTEDCGGGSCSISEPGDIDLDTWVNVQDVIFLVNFILATEVPNDYQQDAADMNHDTNLDVLDVISLVNLILDPCDECVI